MWWTDLGLPLPFRLGYFLADPSPAGATLPYQGADRPLSLPDIVEGGEHPESGAYTELVKELESALEHKLPADLRVARHYAHRLADFDIAAEVVYAEIVAVPHDPAHYETGADWAEAVGALLIPRLDIHRAVEPPPGDAIFAGFDVSLPGPDFHSAIVRPGLSDAQRHLELTSEGCLFTSLEEAEPVLEVANRRNPGGLPFCLVGVWCVPADSVPL